MDTDKSGTISKTELQVGLSRGGVKLSNQVAEKVQAMKNESGTTHLMNSLYKTAKTKRARSIEKHQTSFKPKNGPNIKTMLSRAELLKATKVSYGNPHVQKEIV